MEKEGEEVRRGMRRQVGGGRGEERKARVGLGSSSSNRKKLLN